MSKSLWLLSAGAAALATPAYAQDNPQTTSPVEEAAVQQAEPDQSEDEGNIIVTATRRNEALSDVPIAVSAVGGERLENSGATDIRQLQQLSPSLLVTSTQTEGASTARIRGIGTVGDNPGLESSVAVFIDGVYRSRSGIGLNELGEVERVEVLRGPQGTLFGRNASAGLISIITAAPRFESEVNGQLSYGNYDFYRAELGFTGPASEHVAYRLDGVYQHRDGFMTDVISGRDINDRDRYLVRGQLLYQPSDTLSVRLIGDYAQRDEECCAATYLTAFDTVSSGGSVTTAPSSILPLLAALGATIPQDPSARQASVTPGRNYRQDVLDWGLSAEIVHDFDGMELTSISAYRDNKLVRGGDFDYNNLDIVFRDDDGGSRMDFRTFSQELRLQGETMDGRLDWLIGGYFASERITAIDNLGYGADYERYANCLLINAILPSALAPAPTGNCINVPVVQGTIAFLNSLPATDPRRASIPLLGALIANPARPGFGSLAAAFGVPTATLNNQTPNDRYDQLSRNVALFTHNVFEVTDQLSLTLGLRYTHELKTLDATLVDTNVICGRVAASPLGFLATLPCVLPNVPGGNFSQENVRNSEDNLSGTAVVSFRPTPDLLTYASYSRGYKAGGFNFDRTALPRQIIIGPSGPVAGPVLPGASLSDLVFEPENVDAFEIGVKYDGRGFDLNIAAFHQTFDNFQLNTFNGVNFIVENINSCSEDLNDADSDNNPNTGACSGKVRSGVVSRGVEIEAFMRPMDYLGVNLGLTVVDTKYRDNLVGTDGRPLTNALFQLPDRRLSNSAVWSATGSITYAPPLGDSGLTGLFYVDGRYQSRINTGSDLDIEKEQEGFFLMNARIGVRGAGDRWGLELWAQNLLDEDYTQIAFDAFIQGTGTARGVQQGFYTRSTQLFGAFLGEPRTYGITGRFRF